MVHYLNSDSFFFSSFCICTETEAVAEGPAVTCNVGGDQAGTEPVESFGTCHVVF